MDYYFKPEHEMIRKVVHDFVAAEVEPLAAELDEQERFPSETLPKLARMGLFGIPFPKQYGGTGADALSYAISVEEIAKACATTAVIVCAHTSLCANPIYTFGTEEQKQKYLVPLAKGEKLGAFGLTEPNAGSDAAMQQTTAELVGDKWILNGNKIFITNAGYASTYVVLAMTDKSKGNHGISAFIVPSDAPGFSIGKKEAKLGIRGSATCELIFENAEIPAENLLGPLNGGFKIAMETLNSGRIAIGAQGLGIAAGALEHAKKYMKERVQFGRTLAKNQGLQWVVADLETKVRAARLMVYHAANLKDAHKPFTVEASMAKLYAAETAMEVTTKVVQLFGGYGYTRDYPVERMMRDAKITEIYEGTSEVQRMVIASNILK